MKNKTESVFTWSGLMTQPINPNDPKAVDQVMNAAVWLQKHETGKLKAPCSQMSKLMERVEKETGNDPMPVFKAAVKRFNGVQPVLVSEKLGDAEVLGDANSEEFKAVCDSKITVMRAFTQKTPGNKFQLITATVGQFITSSFINQPVSKTKDGLNYVLAVGAQTSKSTINGTKIQFASRAKRDIENISAFWADIDGTDKAHRIAQRLLKLGYAAVVYTTYSHHEKKTDPDDAGCAVTEGDDGSLIYCHHAHCSHLRTWDMIRLIEQAILDGHAVLPDEYSTLSQLLCDSSFFPEIDGEAFEFDPADYGVIEKVELKHIGTPRKLEKAFKAVIKNERAGDDHFAALYAGMKMAGNKGPTVKKMNELMLTVTRFTANDRKALQKRGAQLIAAEYQKPNKEDGTPHPSMNISDPLGDSMADADATLHKRFRVVNVGGKMRILQVTDPADAGAANNLMALWSLNEFINFHADRRIKIERDGQVIWLDPAKNFAFAAQRYSGVVFAPGDAPCEANDYNIFCGLKVQPKAGDCERLKKFIKEIICDDDQDVYKWVMLWMAHMLQRPHEKPGTALVLHGKGRCGKGVFGKLLRALVSPYGTLALQPEHVVGQFAGPSLATSLLLTSEEAVFAGNPAVSNVVKGMITAERMRVEAKGIQSFEMDSYLRIVFDSNDDLVVKIEGNGSEWRYCVMKIAESRYKDTEYFKGIVEDIEGEAMAALAYELFRYAPKSPGLTWDAVRLAPETDARRRMAHQSYTPATRELLSAVEYGGFDAKDVSGTVFRTTFNEDLPTRVAISDLKLFLAPHIKKLDANEGKPLTLIAKVFGEGFQINCVEYSFIKSKGAVDSVAAIWKEKDEPMTWEDVSARNLWYIEFPPLTAMRARMKEIGSD